MVSMVSTDSNFVRLNGEDSRQQSHSRGRPLLLLSVLLLCFLVVFLGLYRQSELQKEYGSDFRGSQTDPREIADSPITGPPIEGDQTPTPTLSETGESPTLIPNESEGVHSSTFSAVSDSARGCDLLQGGTVPKNVRVHNGFEFHTEVVDGIVTLLRSAGNTVLFTEKMNIMTTDFENRNGPADALFIVTADTSGAMQLLKLPSLLKETGATTAFALVHAAHRMKEVRESLKKVQSQIPKDVRVHFVALSPGVALAIERELLKGPWLPQISRTVEWLFIAEKYPISLKAPVDTAGNATLLDVAKRVECSLDSHTQVGIEGIALQGKIDPEKRDYKGVLSAIDSFMKYRADEPRWLDLKAIGKEDYKSTAALVRDHPHGEVISNKNAREDFILANACSLVLLTAFASDEYFSGDRTSSTVQFALSTGLPLHGNIPTRDAFGWLGLGDDAAFWTESYEELFQRLEELSWAEYIQMRSNSEKRYDELVVNSLQKLHCLM